MRKLMCCAIGYCLAICIGNYLMPEEYLLWFAMVCALFSPFSLLINRKTGKILMTLVLSAAVGFSWLWGHNALFIRPAEALIGHQFEVDARVTDYPSVYDEYTSVDLRLTEDWLPNIKVRVYDYDGTFSDFRPGDELSIELDFVSARVMSNTESDYYLSDGIFLRAQLAGEYKISGKWSFSFLHTPQHIAHSLKTQIIRLFPSDVSALMKALLTGDKSEFYKDDNLYISMKVAGLSHVVAVSGMHVSFILGILQLWTGRRRISAFLGIPLIWFFAAMSGFTPSVIRASAMITLMLIAPIIGRENDGPTSLSAALLLLTLINPRSIASISLQLSFAAMAGILLLSPVVFAKLNELFENVSGIFAGFLRAAAAALSSSIGAIVLTTPLIALHFGFVSLYGVATNLLCLWAMSAAFMLAYPTCIVSYIYFPLAKLIAGIISWLPRYVIFLVKIIAELPFAALSTRNNIVAWWLVLVYALFIAVYLRRRKHQVRLINPICCSIVSFAAVCVFLVFSADKGSEFTALDVGQGQCLVITKDSSTVVIDCGSKGSSENAGDIASDYLLSSGRDSVDLLILTHLHADHANGVVRLMNRVEVLRIVIPENCEDTEYGDSILDLCYDKGIKVYFLENDSTIGVGKLNFKVFAPFGSDNPNENCLIILGETEDFRFLVTGDVGNETEQLFLSFYDVGDIDLLVAGHHGSKYSSCEDLIDITQPETAVISVGINSYGHPAQEVLERFDARGINIRRTDLDGSIIIRMGN